MVFQYLNPSNFDLNGLIISEYPPPIRHEDFSLSKNKLVSRGHFKKKKVLKINLKSSSWYGCIERIADHSNFKILFIAYLWVTTDNRLLSWLYLFIFYYFLTIVFKFSNPNHLSPCRVRDNPRGPYLGLDSSNQNNDVVVQGWYFDCLVLSCFRILSRWYFVGEVRF